MTDNSTEDSIMTDNSTANSITTDEVSEVKETPAPEEVSSAPEEVPAPEETPAPEEAASVSEAAPEQADHPAPEQADHPAPEPAEPSAPRRKRFLWWIPAVFLTLLLLAAGAFALYVRDLAEKPLSEAYRLTLSEDSFRLHAGDRAEFTGTLTETTDRSLLLYLQKRKLRNLRIESSDPAVAVTEVPETSDRAEEATGLRFIADMLRILFADEEVAAPGDIRVCFTATGAGEAVITVSAEDLEARVQVEAFTPASRIGFAAEEYTLNCREKQMVGIIIEPADAVLFEETHYESSDETVVKIDENGQLRAGLPGEAEIRISADGVEGTALVHVYQPLLAIYFADYEEHEKITLERGETLKPDLRYYPENTTDDRTVTYTLSDPSMGTVSADGTFTATGRGPVTLTAKCGKFTASVDLDIRVTLTGIELSRETLDLVYQKKETLTYRLLPEDPTEDLQISWATEDPKVATVDDSGTVTAVRGGTTDILLNINGFEKRCTVTVTVPVTGVRISSGSIFLYTGTGHNLSASVAPSFTTESKGITWTSDNPAVAAVNASGGVTAVSPGVTVIRATHGAFQAACQVTVANMPTSEERAAAIIAYGRQFLGTPYVYGGNSLTSGIDCSGFTQQCFASQHISLYRTSYTQVNQGTPVSLDPSAWKPGDLLFYSPNGSVSHVALYIGDGQIMHAAQSRGGICITTYDYGGITPSHARRYF